MLFRSLELLYHAYGFAGALPRADMDPNAAPPAPQATLMPALPTGTFTPQLHWTMILIGVSPAVVLLPIQEMHPRRGRERGAGARNPRARQRAAATARLVPVDLPRQ